MATRTKALWIVTSATVAVTILVIAVIYGTLLGVAAFAPEIQGWDMSSTKERFLIPDGFKGDVYVIYSVPNGEPSTTTRGEITYHIPDDGILQTRDARIGSWTSSKYYYLRRDGTLDYLSNFWSCTIDPTPENLSNDKDVGVYFPRGGTYFDAHGCSIEYTQVYIGTKAHLLTKYKEQDIGRYLQDHPGACSAEQSK